eukprot:Protomagalhaensia_wolfi_Nauph_80__5614@NODE_63_length_4088_cov_50_951840_g52_i0_p1_GENE_NODE_63_length_4088_cov_50_951840_g52_i0NODE_63_length_4088_cov_50_951840_g52_i0_p1_ORF_typecomplete_len432_score57_36Torus/PF16131_5/0_0075zfCCCH_3/PF15663_5/0_015zfCCCH_4/PF18044_1/1_6_NODE_63_length_4088_cov_50_951840_g52_i027174012
MSQTTTAASSARKPDLSFGWLLSQLPESPSPLESPRVNVSALCRNTFLHLESASPLARVSQSQLIQSFRDFSARLDGNVSRRRHTLTPVVVSPPSLPVRVEPAREAPISSPLARLASRHHQAFQGCVKDDSYVGPSKGGIPPQQPSLPLLRVQREPEISPLSRLSVTPTPLGSYFDNQGFFLPSELNHDKDKAQPEPPDNDCLSPTRSPTRLRPLADLLTEPWSSGGLMSEATNKSPSRPGSAQKSPLRSAKTTASSVEDRPLLKSHTPLRSETTEFRLAEWVGSLPETLVTIQSPGTQASVMSEWDLRSRNRGSLSDLVHLGDCSELQNLFASAVAQALLSGGVDEKKRTTEAVKADDTASGGHPNSCKPCAFYWSKGCLNGENCRFCHEWHAPKKKKPMKDQKNLMIIAREDGRIAFLRCAIEDALRHQ